MFLTVPTQYPLSVPTQANPMTFEQGPVWMLIILLFTIGGILLWTMLTRESAPSEASETESEESESEPVEATSADPTTVAETTIEPEPVVALAAATATPSTTETTTATKKAPAKKRSGRPAQKKRTKPLAGDDFTRIEGVGPKIDTVLKEAGITSYAQLAESSVENLYTVVREANIRAATPDTWPEQAALAAAAQWAELDSLQENLKGGRRVEATGEG